MSVPAVEVGVAAQHRRPLRSGANARPLLEGPIVSIYRLSSKAVILGLQKARLGFYTAATIQGRLSVVGRLALLSVPAAFPAPAVSMLRSPTVGYVWIVPTRLVFGARLPCRRWFNGSAIPLRPRRRDEAACQENLAPSIAATLPHIGALLNAKAPCALFCANRIFRVAGRPAGQAPLGTKCLPGQMRRLPGRCRSKFGKKIAASKGSSESRGSKASARRTT